MEEEKKKEVYSVWALPDEETETRFKNLMESLRSEFPGPKFDPHVTVVGATNLTADEAKKMFEAACDGFKAYTATVDRVSTGTFFYQCVFLLLKSTHEVMRAGEHCKNHFNCSTTTPYMPHLSLLYAELTEEEKKKAQEKAYALDNSLDGLSFRINRLALCKTDIEDKTLDSWEKVVDVNIELLSEETSIRKNVASALIGEALAIKAALTAAKSKGFKELHCFSDSLSIITLLNGNGMTNELKSIFCDICCLKNDFTSISFNFISRS